MKMKCLVMCVVGAVLLVLTSMSFAAEMRKWTNRRGKEFEAEFVKLEKDDRGRDIATLRKPDGTEMRVGLGGLSEDDRKYIRQHAKSGDDTTATKERPAKPDQPRAEKRKWTRNNGESFEAEFVKLEKNDKGRNVVTLRKPDGTEMKAALGSFSPEDKRYITQHAKFQVSGGDQPAVAGSGKPEPKDSPADQPAQQPEKKPESPAEAAAKPSTGGGILAKVAARREHEKQTVEALSVAFKDFPLNCLKAEVVGEPKELKHDQEKTTFQVTVRLQADTKKFEAFRKRLFAALDKVADDMVVDDRSVSSGEQGYGSCLMQLYVGPSGRRELERKKKEAAKPVGRVEAIQRSVDEVGFIAQANENFFANHLLLEVSANEKENNWSKMSWRLYALDKAAKATLKDVVSRTCECRIVSVNAKGEKVLLNKSPIGITAGWPPDEYRTLAQLGGKERFTISDIFYDEHAKESFQPALIFGVEVTMADAELKTMQKMTCELRDMEISHQDR